MTLPLPPPTPLKETGTDLENTTTREAYRAAGGDCDGEENQRIIARLIEREVSYNVGNLVSGVYRLVVSTGDPDGIFSEDDLRDLMCRSATAQDAAEDNGIAVVENDCSDWYWYTTTRANRDVNLKVPPKGYTIHQTDTGWVAHDALGDVVAPEVSEEATILECWGLAGVSLHGPHTDADAAWEDACDEERIDTGSYDSEVYEHWIVSRFAGGKLKEQGEVVGELANLTIWGRTCTGQAISLDGTWTHIAAEMQILAGQRYSWAEAPSPGPVESRRQTKKKPAKKKKKKT